MSNYRMLLALGLSCLLGACATSTGSPPPNLPCPASLTADPEAEPQVPAGAGIVQPCQDDTDACKAERAATDSFLTFDAAHAAWGKRGWARAGEAKAYCDRQK